MDRRQKKESNAKPVSAASDGEILLKRCFFFVAGLFFIGSPIIWTQLKNREWSLAMTIVCLIGAAFIALALFGSRRNVDDADITF